MLSALAFFRRPVGWSTEFCPTLGGLNEHHRHALWVRRCSRMWTSQPPKCSVPVPRKAKSRSLIDRHKLIFIKPLFKGGVGKKGKVRPDRQGERSEDGARGERAALFRRASPRERRRQGQRRDLRERRAGRARGLFRNHAIPPSSALPTMTLTHMGGIDIEELDKKYVAQVPFEALTGLKAFVVANALTDIGAPKEIISPLVQHLPKLWELCAPLRHDDAGAQSDPDAAGPRRAPHAGRLRLQMRLRSGRSALAPPRSAGPSVHSRYLRLRT